MKRILRHSFSLLNIDYAKLTNKWNYNNVISPYYRIYLIDEGEGTIANLNEHVKLEPGFLYIIPSYTLCSLNCPERLGVYFVHFFEDSNDGISLFQYNRSLMKVKANEIDKANFSRLLQINPGRGINRSDNPRVYEKDVYYREYEELNNLQPTGTFIETQGIILQLISRFLNLGRHQQSISTSIPSKIVDAMSYININLKENITVTMLAARANLNRDYFSRLFYKYTGTRPINYLHEKRIERAQYLIRRTTQAFEEIAQDTGFENAPYFYKLFKRKTSLTPDQYRKMNSLI